MSLAEKKLAVFGSFMLDMEERTLRYGNETVPIAPKVMETLCLLVRNAGRLLTKDEMISAIWPDTFVEERNLTQHIFTLRKVLGEGTFVETVPRRGYRFVAKVEFLEETPQSGINGSRDDGKKVEQREDEGPTDPIFAREKVSGSRSPWLIASLGSLMAVVAIAVGAFSVFKGGGDMESTAEARNMGTGLLQFDRLTDTGDVYYPTVSPDSNFIAYVVLRNNRYGIELRQIATGAVSAVVDADVQQITRPVFSADGNHLYYRQDSEIGRQAAVFRVPILGGTPRMINGNINSDVAISPDGKLLSFLRFDPEINGEHLIVCNAEDGSNEIVVASRHGEEHFIIWNRVSEWSPDGSRIFVWLRKERQAEEGGPYTELGTINIADGRYERIPTPDWDSTIEAVWESDGRGLLVLAREKASDPFQIWRLSYPDGEAKRVTNDLNDYRSISTFPDGARVVTTHERTFFNIWLVSTSAPGELRQLTFTTESRFADRGITWTPDSAKLIFTLVEDNIESNLWSLDIETLEKRQITFDDNRMNWFPRVTPDGRSVIFASNRTGAMHIWRSAPDGSGLRQLTDGKGEIWPNVTPDGKWLIYVTPSGLPETMERIPLNGRGQPVEIVRDAGGSTAIHPDGATAIISYRGRDADGSPEYKYGTIVLTPGAIPSELPFKPSISVDAWKSDGSGFYWVDRGPSANNLHFFSVRDGTSRQLTQFEEMRIGEYALSPDQRTIAVSRGRTVSNVYQISGIDEHLKGRDK